MASCYSLSSILEAAVMGKLIIFCCRVLQMGYNLLYGLQKASYDADCSLFLNILKEEVKVRAVWCRPAHEADSSLFHSKHATAAHG